ncbi:hypothetical protein LJC48_05375 [Desulfovibrio sp. OttesenSCG-928-C06]|nr:hypothetical protein [Desulfovibrio sp. OttesenSCG-928-C06]
MIGPLLAEGGNWILFVHYCTIFLLVFRKPGSDWSANAFFLPFGVFGLLLFRHTPQEHACGVENEFSLREYGFFSCLSDCG